MTETLHIQLLGGLQVKYAGQSIHAFESPRLRSLLAVLVLHAGRPQPRQQLAFLFWPDTTDAQAQTNLRVLVHRLRRLLPNANHLLSADSRSLTWAAEGPYSLDVQEFRSAAYEARSSAALDGAVDRYKGDLLPECYDDWIAVERDRLREEFARLLDRAIVLRESERDYREAILYTRRLVEHEPLDENACQRLMRLLALTGDRAGADRAYRECEAALRRDLGVEPRRETQQLYRALIKDGEVPAFQTAESHILPRHNLPAYPTSFVGRQREVDIACKALRSDEVRLLTLTGTGGIGKTRLAIEVAQGVLPDFEAGVFLVSLGSVADPDLVAPSIAHALGIQEARARTSRETLTEYLRGKRLLLLLDNMEHLLDATPLVSDLLQAAAYLKVLVTSRQPLHLYGEHAFAVPTLTVPERERPLNADVAGEHEAVSLFVQRARAANPHFQLTDADASLVAELCRRLDGLPLAIELAAARSSMLSPTQLLERVGDSLGILRGGPKDSAPRHQTLWDTISWSYNLLTPPQRTLFAKLAVFSGGCSLEAVQAVCTTGGDVDANFLDDLQALVDRSLVRTEHVRGGQRRFVMLETIHSYALELLEQSGAIEDLRRRHIDYYLELSEEVEPKLRGIEQQHWLQQLDLERDNLRSALVQSFDQQAYEKALRLFAAISRLWSVRGYLLEWNEWIETACTVGNNVPSILLAEAFRGAGAVSAARGEFRRAASYYEEGLARLRESGDRTAIIHVLHGLASASWILGDYSRAEALFEESLSLRYELRDQQHIAVAQSSLGWISLLRGDVEKAISLCEQSLLQFTRQGDKRGMGIALSYLGKAALEQADYIRARDLLQKSQEMLRAVADMRNLAVTQTSLGLAELGQSRYEAAHALLDESLRLLTRAGGEMELAYTVEGLVGLASRQGNGERASRLAGAAEGLRERAGTPRIPIEQDRYQQYLTIARSRTDPATWDEAWAEGRAMTHDQVLTYALAHTLTT